MNWFGVVGVTFGIFGIAYAGRFYWELRKWAYLIKYARVMVAYKNKVKLNAPLEEWALWCRNADNDQTRHGQVLYQYGGTTIAVTGKSFVPEPPIVRPILWLIRKIRPTIGKVNPQIQEGTWEAHDETPKESQKVS